MELDIHPVLYNWINAFLSKRKQAVRIGGFCQTGNPQMVVYLKELNLVILTSTSFGQSVQNSQEKNLKKIQEYQKQRKWRTTKNEHK